MHGARMRPSARVQPLRCTAGRHVLPACVLGGRRRTIASVRASYYPGQGPDPMQGGRRYRRGRDLQQQLADMLMGGPVDDPDRFLQLLSSSPRLLDRRMLPPQQAGPSLEDLYRLQQQQQRQQAAEAEAARRRAVEEAEVEERRREALRAAMLQNARRHLPRYDSPSLARLASALASAGVEDPALCNDIMAELQRRAQAQQAPPEPRSLAELFDALATMHHRPSDEQVESLLRAQQQQQREREREEKEWQQRALLEQQRAEAEQRRRMLLQQQQQQQQRRTEEEEQQRRRLAPQQQVVSVPGAGSMTPDDAARLLQSMSRLGYRPDDRTLSQLLEVLQPQRLQLQPAPQQKAAVHDVGEEDEGEEEDEEGYEDEEAEQAVMDEADAEAAVRLSLERDAQAVANAVRALERMGRPDRAAQLRQRFQQHVMGVQARLARERRVAAQQRARAEAEARVRAKAEAEARARAEAEARAKMEAQARAKAEAEAKAKAEAEAKAKEEAAAKAAAAACHEEQRRQALKQQQQEAEDAEGPIAPYVVQLRAQLSKALRAAASWQQIRGLLFNYQEALDLPCLVAAAARLVELLSARTTGMVLRERAELGDLLQGWGELTRRRLGRASASQTCSLLVCVCRLRYLDEQLLVALLRRLRDTLPAARGGELAAVLRALAACGVRPSPPWMDSFLGRLEETLEEVSTQDLIELSVCLMQLEAHPDRSWLGAYLDEVQAREGELTPLQVADAVRAVAAMDRPFLAAWRQAAAFKQQMGQQAPRQAQKQASASAVESVDDVLGEQDDEAGQQGGLPEGLQAALPPMHPKQQSMAPQQPQTQQQQQPQFNSQSKAVSPAAEPGAQAGSAEQQQQQPAASGRLRPPPLQSVELDVDSEQAAAASVEGASSSGRQLPGSRSVEGLYYGHEDEDEDEEGELYDEGEGTEGPGPRLVLDEQVAEAEADADAAHGVGTPAAAAGGAAAAAGAGASSAQQQGQAKPSGSALGGKGMVIELKPSMGQPELQGVQAARGGAATKAEQQGSPTATPPPVAEERKAQSEQQTPPPQQQQQQQQKEQKEQGKTAEASKAQPQTQKAAADEKDGDKGKGGKEEQKGKKEQPKSEKQLKEEAAQVRALRSLLLEWYEAVQVYKEELEARQRRAQAEEARLEEDGAVRQFSDAEVAAAARVMAAREQLQRLQADYDNFKRRAEAEREVAIARARGDALKPLLGLADNFDRAAQTIKPKTEGEKLIHDSYQAVNKELKQFFKEQGLSEVGQEGDMFDPNVHEAVMREERDDLEDGTITAVFQKGYRLGDLLVRPALVRVAYS